MQLSKIKIGLSSIVVLVALLMVSAVTFCHFFAQQNMDMHASSDMAAGMHFDSQNSPACCQMQSGHSPLQNTVADISKKALPENANALFALSLIFFAFSYLLVINKIFVSKLYYVRHLFKNYYNFLIQIFSQGILQPQIYNA